MSNKKFALKIYVTVLLLSFLTVGCATQTRHYATSATNYLYPEKENMTDAATIPTLSFPLRIGIAFVPHTDSSYYSTFINGPENEKRSSEESLDEQEKMVLMKKFSDQLSPDPCVKSIEIIPTAYLNAKGGFQNLDQIKTMHKIDLIVLLSYDHVQYTDKGIVSASYWTLIGAYVCKGEKNDTSTMIEAALYDIKSRKMLIRASGLSHVKHSATPVNLSEQLRKDSKEGFDKAFENLVENFKVQLNLFKDKVKESPQEYKIAYKENYNGTTGIGIEGR